MRAISFVLLAGIAVSLNVRRISSPAELPTGKTVRLVPFVVSSFDPNQILVAEISCQAGQIFLESPCGTRQVGNAALINQFLGRARGSVKEGSEGEFSVFFKVKALYSDESFIEQAHFKILNKIHFKYSQTKVKTSDDLPIQIGEVLAPYDTLPLSLIPINVTEKDRLTLFQGKVDLETYNFDRTRTIEFILVHPESGVESDPISITVVRKRQLRMWAWLAVLFVAVASVLASVFVVFFFLFKLCFRKIREMRGKRSQDNKWKEDNIVVGDFESLPKSVISPANTIKEESSDKVSLGEDETQAKKSEKL